MSSSRLMPSSDSAGTAANCSACGSQRKRTMWWRPASLDRDGHP